MVWVSLCPGLLILPPLDTLDTNNNGSKSVLILSLDCREAEGWRAVPPVLSLGCGLLRKLMASCGSDQRCGSDPRCGSDHICGSDQRC